MANDPNSELLAKLDLEERGVPPNLPRPAELPAGTICVICYARISNLSGKRQDNRKRTVGVENQHATGRTIARRENVVIVKRYTDNDLSASKDDFRPDFESMLTDLHRGFTEDGYPVHGVIAVDNDRIYKTPIQWQRFIEAFRAKPGRVFADDFGTEDLYSENAEIIGLVEVAMMMGENRKRKGRTRRWHEGQARRGVAHTGGRVFGYLPVEDGRIEIVPEEANLIRAAVEACIEGKSWGTITRIFADSGIPTAKGGPWRAQTVKQIVSNPRNAGLRILDGRVFCDEDGQQVIGQWEAIITPAEWELVAERYWPRERLPGGNTKNARPVIARKYELSGLLRCGKLIDGRRCNTVMRAAPDSYNPSKHRYSCRPKADGGCAGTSVLGSWIEKEISDLVLLALDEKVGDSDDLPPWEREEELAIAEQTRDDFESRWTRRQISNEQFYRLAPSLDETVKELRKSKKEFEAAHARPSENSAERRERWGKRAEDGGYDLQQRRNILFSEIQAVIIFPVGRGKQKRGSDSYEVVWR
ncbi:recombinase family protein [Nocardia sp. NPDC052566]|uniref:recombinase family protein n=1 Tax=Nocardia sp. NPDC052566 TaxID=3364330 RepID=UPI0037C6B288